MGNMMWQGDISSQFKVKLECGVGDEYSNPETVGRAEEKIITEHS